MFCGNLKHVKERMDEADIEMLRVALPGGRFTEDYCLSSFYIFCYFLCVRVMLLK